MTVDRACVGVDPDVGRSLYRSDGPVEELRRADPRFEYGQAVRLPVAAVDASARKVDANVASVEFRDPWA
jgi:hypothetical protein